MQRCFNTLLHPSREHYTHEAHKQLSVQLTLGPLTEGQSRGSELCCWSHLTQNISLSHPTIVHAAPGQLCHRRAFAVIDAATDADRWQHIQLYWKSFPPSFCSCSHLGSDSLTLGRSRVTVNWHNCQLFPSKEFLLLFQWTPPTPPPTPPSSLRTLFCP